MLIQIVRACLYIAVIFLSNMKETAFFIFNLYKNRKALAFLKPL
ncbi:hypothetical protein HMPREF9396_2307 [Streptococcus sanguinis SK1059]|uniref:Uncharacterized protein n=1 Tax=Streptococcus sanguinis SK405 TaxID=888817 RepID=A0ABC9PAR0_STRSA|nr:hypothetical protein HMPREF9390_2193 [Streptococcus sanguinis SK405]EGJ41293.1 hypothetical protein HMPREF9396_2307 [Streptococcus sanguinis SK1059]EGQ18254.1 hypothetical protein HMPREF8573_2295 [Streptococcus sanguinis ATCC 29667]EGQ25879.1 hypothetical protein HMPREF9387_0110 [Streptococcus sanguinis SK340]